MIFWGTLQSLSTGLWRADASRQRSVNNPLLWRRLGRQPLTNKLSLVAAGEALVGALVSLDDGHSHVVLHEVAVRREHTARLLELSEQKHREFIDSQLGKTRPVLWESKIIRN